MRKIFSGYYPPSENELKEMWEGATIVLDTNALLNFYRYSSKTQDGIWPILDTLKDRLWIPHQVGLEFHKRRISVMADQIKAVDAVKERIRGYKPDLENLLNTHARQEIINSDAILKKFEQGIVDTIEIVEEAHRQLKNQSPADPTHDPVMDKITELFDGKVGTPYSSEKLDQIRRDGKTRYENKVPPGYKDAGKDNDNAYGDWILWRQLLDYVCSEPRDVIFITDDQKEDWWRREQGKTFGPRPELVEEFKKESGGKRVHFYKPQRFWEYANAQGGFRLTEETLGEIEDLSFRSAIDELIRIASTIKQPDGQSFTPFDNDPENYNPIIDRLKGRRERLMRRAEDLKLRIHEIEMKRHLAINETINLDDQARRDQALVDIENQFTNNIGQLQKELSEIYFSLTSIENRLIREIDRMRDRPNDDII